MLRYFAAPVLQSCSCVRNCREVCCKAPSAAEAGDLIDFNADLGYPTPISLHQALCDWTEAHHWTLLTLVDILILLNGGVDYNGSGTRGLVVIVKAIPKTDNLNPARAFKVVNAEVGDQARYPRLALSWRDINEVCEEGFRTLMPVFEQSGVAPELSPVSVFPVLYVVQHTGMMVGKRHTLLRRPLRHVPQPVALHDPHTRTVLEDVVRLCTYLAGSEIVLRTIPTEGLTVDYIPIVGRMVRAPGSKKAWKWKAVPWNWDTWIIPSTQLSIRSGLSLQELITVLGL